MLHRVSKCMLSIQHTPHCSHNSGTKTYNDPRLVDDDPDEDEEIVERVRIEEVPCRPAVAAAHTAQTPKPAPNAWKVASDCNNAALTDAARLSSSTPSSSIAWRRIWPCASKCRRPWPAASLTAT